GARIADPRQRQGELAAGQGDGAPESKKVAAFARMRVCGGPAFWRMRLRESNSMADVRKKVPENVASEFFVDTTCIDCDACRQLAVCTFAEAGDDSCAH